MSGSQLRTELFPADGRIVTGPFNFFFALSASANFSALFQKGGTTFGASGIGAGYIKRNIESWERGVLTGTPGASISFFIGIEAIAEDDTDFRTQIATIAGITQISEQPAATLLSTAAAVLATATSLDIAANPSRRRITICNESVSLGSVWVRDQAATANGGEELQPGTSKEFKGTYALRVRNNSGANATISTNEES